MKKIMFICTGNICRSAMAEKMLNKKVTEQKMNIEVYSCGIDAKDGDIPTREAIQVMEEKGIDLTKHKAINIAKSNIQEMDIILCATNIHKMKVIGEYPKLEEKTFTIKEYAEENPENISIKDPWGYNINVYRKCAQELEECIDKLIKKL